MVNLLEMMYAITAVAVLSALYFLIRGRETEKARELFTGALWISAIGLVACASLYWLLS